MNTTGQLIETGRRRRRSHSAHFKAETVGACPQAGVSIAAVALARGLNAAMLHRWVKQAERSGKSIAIRATAPSLANESEEGFVSLPLPSHAVVGAIRIEVPRRGGRVSVEWPASAPPGKTKPRNADRLSLVQPENHCWYPIGTQSNHKEIDSR